MAKLRDMTLNVIPKLDVRKANAMAKKLGGMLGRATGKVIDVFKKGGSFLGKAGIALNQGMELFDKIAKIVNKPLGLVDSAMGMGDQIADMAESIRSTPGRLMQLLTSLSAGGASATGTMQLLKKFASTAEENGITGNLDDAFIETLRMIGQEKDGAKRQALIKKYFGARAGVAAKDAIAAAMNWDTLKTSAQSNIDYGKAAEAAERAAGKRDDINFWGELERMKIAAKSGKFDIANNIAQMQQNQQTQLLGETSGKAMYEINKVASSISGSLDILIQKLIGIATDMAEGKGLLGKINEGLQGLQTLAKNPIGTVTDAATNLWNTMTGKNK